MTGIPAPNAASEAAREYANSAGGAGQEAPVAAPEVDEPALDEEAPPSESHEDEIEPEQLDDEPTAEEAADEEPQSEFDAELKRRTQEIGKTFRSQLRDKYGDELPGVMNDANRALHRFASPELRQALKQNPALAAPGFVELLANVGRFLKANKQAAPPADADDPTSGYGYGPGAIPQDLPGEDGRIRTGHASNDPVSNATAEYEDLDRARRRKMRADAAAEEENHAFQRSLRRPRRPGF
ncbi:MAG: hypothetical protein NXI31_10830 [bacterium]|nr:hypothetical protein [bacterium]